MPAQTIMLYDVLNNPKYGENREDRVRYLSSVLKGIEITESDLVQFNNMAFVYTDVPKKDLAYVQFFIFNDPDSTLSTLQFISFMQLKGYKYLRFKSLPTHTANKIAKEIQEAFAKAKVDSEIAVIRAKDVNRAVIAIKIGEDDLAESMGLL